MGTYLLAVQIFRRILVKGKIIDGKKKIYVSHQCNFTDMAEDELYKYFGEQRYCYYLVFPTICLILSITTNKTIYFQQEQ